MTTDPRVEAVARVILNNLNPADVQWAELVPETQSFLLQVARAALEAADRAAWCFDITAAPGMTFLSLAIECNGERFLYHDAARTEDGSWLDSDGDPIDEDLIVAWRLPPALPEVNEP